MFPTATAAAPTAILDDSRVHQRICRLQSVSSLDSRLAGLGHGSLPESVLEAPADSLQVAHTASTSGLPPLGLHRPVV